MAVLVDEYYLNFPTMPAAIAGLGIHGIESANGKLIKERAAKAEEQRLEEAIAAKAEEEAVLARRRLEDEVRESEALVRQVERDSAKKLKGQLLKQRKVRSSNDTRMTRMRPPPHKKR